MARLDFVERLKGRRPRARSRVEAKPRRMPAWRPALTAGELAAFLDWYEARERRGA